MALLRTEKLGQQVSNAVGRTVSKLQDYLPVAGGSAVASDAIHRQVLRLRQSGKTVVVSMGNAAASGGYYISCPANKIVAQPATLTGSIGVLAGVTRWMGQGKEVIIEYCAHAAVVSLQPSGYSYPSCEG